MSAVTLGAQALLSASVHRTWRTWRGWDSPAGSNENFPERSAVPWVRNCYLESRLTLRWAQPCPVPVRAPSPSPSLALKGAERAWEARWI
jgi:hypothetical protein